MIPVQDSKNMQLGLCYVEYLWNATRYRHSYKRVSCSISNGAISNELE